MKHNQQCLEAVINNRESMQPIPTDIEPEWNQLDDIRCVVFDVYGTLLISGSGDVGSADHRAKDRVVAESISQVGLMVDSMPLTADLYQEIRRMNDARRSETCPHPEVDIVQAWRNVLARCGVQATVEQSVQLAAEYESRSNPTWPMPGAQELLDVLTASPLVLGIVSNAQVFTIPLVKDLADEPTLTEAGFELDLCFFSNRFRQSKPGPRLFAALCQALLKRDIRPEHAIYVGNDLLNDVWAASQAGLKTAWFVGDQRSCRQRSDDPRCQSLVPDLILTDLLQLPGCL